MTECMREADRFLLVRVSACGTTLALRFALPAKKRRSSSIRLPLSSTTSVEDAASLRSSTSRYAVS